MMMTPRDWYWFVGEDDTRVYSSAINAYVPADDGTFVAKKAMGYSKIANEPELWEVMQTTAPGFLPIWLWNGSTFIQPAAGVYTDDQLIGYAAEARRVKMAGDIVVNGLPFSTDPITFSSLNSAYIYTQGNTGATFSWKLPDGTFITLGKADVDALLNATNEFAQDCFACEDNAITGVEDGTITTTEQIDAAFAAISNSFTGLVADPSSVRHKRK